jgi:hypothetical protein
LFLKQQAWGNVVARLLAELPIAVAEDLLDKAKVLDGFYIATRYANGHPEGAPFEHLGSCFSEADDGYAGQVAEAFQEREIFIVENRSAPRVEGIEHAQKLFLVNKWNAE